MNLVALISNRALGKASLPSRLKILDWGENKSTKGSVHVSDLTARQLPARQRAAGFEEVALDFEHNTVPGTHEYARTQEPRPVGGYGRVEVVPGDGLYLNAMRWTPRGQIDALNFADLSPTVELDAQGNVVFLHSVALTRNGAVHDLSFFSTAASPQVRTDLLWSKSKSPLTLSVGLAGHNKSTAELWNAR